jgi:plasmid maintenance system antidote protein VapI
MEALFWLNLQSRYDMEMAKEELQDRLEKEVRPFSHAA